MSIHIPIHMSIRISIHIPIHMSTPHISTDLTPHTCQISQPRSRHRDLDLSIQISPARVSHRLSPQATQLAVARRVLCGSDRGGGIVLKSDPTAAILQSSLAYVSCWLSGEEFRSGSQRCGARRSWRQPTLARFATRLAHLNSRRIRQMQSQYELQSLQLGYTFAPFVKLSDLPLRSVRRARLDARASPLAQAEQLGVHRGWTFVSEGLRRRLVVPPDTEETEADADAVRGLAPVDAAAEDDAASAGAPSAHSARADKARADTAHADTARAETARAETARAETARADTARADTARADTARADTARHVLVVYHKLGPDASKPTGMEIRMGGIVESLLALRIRVHLLCHSKVDASQRSLFGAGVTIYEGTLEMQVPYDLSHKTCPIRLVPTPPRTPPPNLFERIPISYSTPRSTPTAPAHPHLPFHPSLHPPRPPPPPPEPPAVCKRDVSPRRTVLRRLHLLHDAHHVSARAARRR